MAFDLGAIKASINLDLGNWNSGVRAAQSGATQVQRQLQGMGRESHNTGRALRQLSGGMGQETFRMRLGGVETGWILRVG